MLSIKNLNVWIDDKKILENVNVEFNYSEISVVIGPNGSGKSTLIRAILNDKRLKKEGKIILDGEDITNLETYKIAEKIYVAFQYPPEVEYLNTEVFLESLYNGKSEIYNLINDFNLPKDIFYRGLNYGLSGGERKKFEIILSLLRDYKVYIFDEPDSGLDEVSIKKVSEIISKLKKMKKCVIVITHTNRLFRDFLPDKVYIMKDGKIIGSEKPENINRIDYE
ncbi:MAG: ATP-binding cassette domain-containing protein [Nanopusillaceae archaeon]